MVIGYLTGPGVPLKDWSSDVPTALCCSKCICVGCIQMCLMCISRGSVCREQSLTWNIWENIYSGVYFYSQAITMNFDESRNQADDVNRAKLTNNRGWWIFQPSISCKTPSRFQTWYCLLKQQKATALQYNDENWLIFATPCAVSFLPSNTGLSSSWKQSPEWRHFRHAPENMATWMTWRKVEMQLSWTIWKLLHRI